MKTVMQTLPIRTDMDPFYRESQGEKGDAEILERYKVIINYFAENPHRAVAGKNGQMLHTIYYNDRVLMKNEQLRERLRKKILNSPEVFNEIMEDTGRTMTGGSGKK